MQISQVASHAVTGLNRSCDQAAKATADIANMASGENTVAKEVNAEVGLGVKALNMANETMGNVVNILV